jgi:hypothetical protein
MRASAQQVGDQSAPEGLDIAPIGAAHTSPGQDGGAGAALGLWSPHDEP